MNDQRAAAAAATAAASDFLLLSKWRWRREPTVDNKETRAPLPLVADGLAGELGETRAAAAMATPIPP